MIRQTPLRAVTLAPSRLLFRPSSFTPASTRFLATETRTTVSTTQRTSSPPPSSLKSAQAPSSSPAQPHQLTYLVERTASRNFSVYNDTRTGGSKKETVVKKIVGDINALKNELTNELGFEKDHVKINPVTGHIKIKGFHADRVTKWLAARGF